MNKMKLLIVICLIIIVIIFLYVYIEGNNEEEKQNEEEKGEIVIRDINTFPETPTQKDSIHINFTIENTLSNVSLYDNYRAYLLNWRDDHSTPGAKLAGIIPNSIHNWSILIGSNFTHDLINYYKIIIINDTHPSQIDEINVIGEELEYSDSFKKILIMETETYSFSTIT